MHARCMLPAGTVYASPGAVLPACCTRLAAARTDGRMHATRMLRSVARVPCPWEDSFIEGLCMLSPWHNDGHDGAHAAPWRTAAAGAPRPAPPQKIVRACGTCLLARAARTGMGPGIAASTDRDAECNPPGPKLTSHSRDHDQRPRGEASAPPDPQCSIDRMYDRAWEVLSAATRAGARPRAHPLAILRRGAGGHVCRMWEVNFGLGWWATWLHAGVYSMPAAMGGRACAQLAVMPVDVSPLRDP